MSLIRRSSNATLEPQLLLVLASIVLLSLLANNIETAKVPIRSSQCNANSKRNHPLEQEIIDYYENGDDEEEDNYEEDIDPYRPVTYNLLMRPKKCEGFTCPFQSTCGEAELNPLTPKNNQKGYVTGGENATYGEWPSYAKLRWENKFRCGGVLITNRHILTAAHCVIEMNPYDTMNSYIVSPESMLVFLGDHNRYIDDQYEQKFEVERICASKYFENLLWGGSHDYAVITLKQDVQFNDHVQPACLPYRYKPIGERMMNPNAIKPKCFVVGLGMMGSQRATVVQKMPMCQINCSQMNDKNVRDDDRSRHCFIKEGKEAGSACIGDSGGPLLCLNPETERWTVIGITSYGSKFGCDYLISPPDIVSVFARVPAILGLINDDCGKRDELFLS